MVSSFLAYCNFLTHITGKKIHNLPYDVPKIELEKRVKRKKSYEI